MQMDEAIPEAPERVGQASACAQSWGMSSGHLQEPSAGQGGVMNEGVARFKYRVLVVDDDPLMLSVLKWYLERAGFDATIVTNVCEGLDAASRELPFAIIMDVMMPGVGGLQALRKLKSQDSTRHIPVIIITANDHPSTIREANLGGAWSILIKPFSPAKLISEIERLTK